MQRLFMMKEMHQLLVYFCPRNIPWRSDLSYAGLVTPLDTGQSVFVVLNRGAFGILDPNLNSHSLWVNEDWIDL